MLFKNLAKKTKEKKQVGLHETKKLYIVKETINKVKKQPTNWGKLSANHTSDNGLIFNLCKKIT